MRKVKWEPKVTRNEKPKEKGQGYLELLMFSQKMKGEKIFIMDEKSCESRSCGISTNKYV